MTALMVTALVVCALVLLVIGYNLLVRMTVRIVEDERRMLAQKRAASERVEEQS